MFERAVTPDPGVEYSLSEAEDPLPVPAPKSITMEACMGVVQVIVSRAGYFLENRHLQTLTEQTFDPLGAYRVVAATAGSKDVLGLVNAYIGKRVAAGAPFGIDFEMATVGE